MLPLALYERLSNPHLCHGDHRRSQDAVDVMVKTSNVDHIFQTSLSKSRHKDARVPHSRISGSVVNHATRTADRRTKCRNIFVREVNKVFKQNSCRGNNVSGGSDEKADANKAGSECGRIHVDVYLLCSCLKV